MVLSCWFGCAGSLSSRGDWRCGAGGCCLVVTMLGSEFRVLKCEESKLFAMIQVQIDIAVNHRCRICKEERYTRSLDDEAVNARRLRRRSSHRSDADMRGTILASPRQHLSLSS